MSEEFYHNKYVNISLSARHICHTFASEKKTSKMKNIEDKAVSGMQKIGKAAVDGYKAIEKGAVEGYKTIEKCAVEGYMKIKNGAVEGWEKLDDKMIDKLFRREGETLEQTKERLRKKHSVEGE